MSIFKEFDTIVSALSRSEYKNYVDAYYWNKEKNSKTVVFDKKTVNSMYENIENILSQYAPDIVSLCSWTYHGTDNIITSQIISVLGIDEEYFDKIEDDIYNQLNDLYDAYTKYADEMGEIFDKVKPYVTEDPEKDAKILKTKVGKSLEEIRSYILDKIREVLNTYLVGSKVSYVVSAFPFKDKDNQHMMPTDSFRHVYDNLFSNKWRVYLPYDANENKRALVKDDIESDKDNSFFMDNIIRIILLYLKALGKSEEYDALTEKISSDKDDLALSILGSGKYSFITTNRKISVGKIFEYVSKKIIDSDSELADQVPSLFNDTVTFFNQHKLPNDLDLVIVVSRHPYDIAGMSTNRGWRSCMEINNGQFREYVSSSITAGVLAAYLCYSNDTTDIVDSRGKHHKNNKINIQNPLGRILIKPFYRRNTKTIDFDDPNFVLICSKSYGIFFKDAIKIVQKWLDDNWNNNIVEASEEKKYKFSYKNFYKEDEDEPYIDYDEK